MDIKEMTNEQLHKLLILKSRQMDNSNAITYILMELLKRDLISKNK